MKKNQIIALVLFSFAFMSFTPAGKDIKGVRKGSYKTFSGETGIIVFFKRGKVAEVYSQSNSRIQKVRGTYALHPGNELLVSYQLPGESVTKAMKGKLYTSENKVSGEWQSSGKETGSFYFQKQMTEEGEEIISVDLLTVKN